MAERECRVFRLFSRYALFFFDLLRFFNLSEKDYDECYNEDSKGNHKRWSSVRDLCLCSIADKSTHDDVNSNSCCRVEHTTYLDKLVTGVTATTKKVKHRVNNGVEHTHAETCNERTNQIDCKAKASAQPLHQDADDTNYQRQKCSFLITQLFD